MSCLLGRAMNRGWLHGESGINPYSAEIFVLYIMETKGCFQFEIIILNVLALSASFEYLCYWSMAIIFCSVPSMLKGLTRYIFLLSQNRKFAERSRANIIWKKYLKNNTCYEHQTHQTEKQIPWPTQ